MAIFDPVTNTWSLDIFAPLPGIIGSGISDRLESGDLFVVGTFSDLATSTSFPVRVNLTYPGDGEVALMAYNDAGTDFSFVHPYLSVNSFGDFLGTQLTTTTTKKGKRTTTSTQSSLFKYTSQLQLDASDLEFPSKLNNQLDYFAKLESTQREVLNVDGTGAYLDIVASIDFTSAPSINWDSPETTLEFREITDRINVGADSDPTNDLPIILGYAEVIRGPYTAVSSQPILLTPVLVP